MRARFQGRVVQGLYFDELSVGQSAETTHVVGSADIEAFAAVSGDVNPVHLDDAYAKTTTFGVRIGDPVTTRVTVKALDAAKAHATLETQCLVNGKTAVDGEALILVPRRG